MKIYLAARYSRREELCRYAQDLRGLGHEITSRWLQGNHQLTAEELAADGGAEPEKRARFAHEDWWDLHAAEMCISFTEQPRSNSRGGRHVEFGIALARGMDCLVVGPRENVFHCLPGVHWYPDWRTALAEMQPADREA